MPNRYVRESAIESDAVNSLSWLGEVFWRRLLNRADDFGRFTAHHPLLRALIFPLQLDRVRDADIPRLLAECQKAGLLFVYTVAGKQFLVLNKWEKGRAKNSEYPEPPADICLRMKTYVYGCLHMSPTPTPITDTDSDADNSSAKGADDPTPADAIYELYPKKRGRKAAVKQIEFAIRERGIDAIKRQTEAYAAAVAQWPESERQYVPDPERWFKRGNYDDDPSTWVRQKSGGFSFAHGD